ncbi:MAG: hypothetical protein AAF525_04610 [Pseudomonadota bacterium]
MPIVFQLEREVAVFTTIGDVDFDEGILVLKDGVSELTALAVNPVILFDVQQTEEDRSSGEMRTIVDALQEQVPGVSIAVLVASDLHYGIARMFGSYAEGAGLNTMVFRDRQSAWEWCAEQRGSLQGDQVKVISSTRPASSDQKNLGDAS